MSDLTTAVVLARGLGTRMRAAGASGLTAEQSAAADAGAKAMMPTAGRPFLDHSLNALADAGITEAILVIGPEHTGVRTYYDALPTERLTIRYAIQAEPNGTADAVAAAEDAVGDRRFVVVNGDNLYSTAAIRALAATPGAALVGYDKAALIEQGNIPAERIAAFALLTTHPDGTLDAFVEKPPAAVVEAAGPHALVSMNCFALTPAVFDVCRTLAPSPRGEFEIVDAVRGLAAREPVRVVPVADGVLDLSRRDDVAAVERFLAGRTVRL